MENLDRPRSDGSLSILWQAWFWVIILGRIDSKLIGVQALKVLVKAVENLQGKVDESPKAQSSEIAPSLLALSFSIFAGTPSGDVRSDLVAVRYKSNICSRSC